MQAAFHDLDIQFSIENYRFHALNFVFERFLRSVPKHSHSSNSYEIHYISSGHGQATIDGAVYRVIPNTLYVTGPHIEHEQVPDKEDPMTEYCIYLKIEPKLPDRKKEKAVRGSFLELIESTHFWFGQDSHNLYPVIQQIFSELEHECTGYLSQVDALLRQLLVLLARNYESRQESRPHYPASNLVDSKYLIIEECFLYEYSSLTLEALSKRLGLGARQTERLLRQHYDKTFMQKKTEAKMSAAALMLSDPSVSITEIANHLGYSSVEHFSTAFKRYYHKSAREFRKEK